MRVRATFSSSAVICSVHATTFQVAEFDAMAQWWSNVIECKDCKLTGYDTLRLSLRDDSPYTEEELHDIAVSNLKHGNHGGFLTAFLDAYLAADPMNVKLLDEPMRTLVAKYSLKDEEAEEDRKTQALTNAPPAAN